MRWYSSHGFLVIDWYFHLVTGCELCHFRYHVRKNALFELFLTHMVFSGISIQVIQADSQLDQINSVLTNFSFITIPRTTFRHLLESNGSSLDLPVHMLLFATEKGYYFCLSVFSLQLCTFLYGFESQITESGYF